MPKKYSFKYIKEQIEIIGWKLISKDYKNCMAKLDIICDNGHEIKMCWNSINDGHGCLICSGKQKHSYEFIKKEIENEGYKLLSNEYINAHSNLKMICPNGHEIQKSWNSIQKKYKCKICVKNGKNNPNYKGNVTKLNIPLYDTYAHQIDYAEKVRRDPENYNYLQVKCTYCGKWHIPKIKNIQHRINALEGKGNGEHRFYCSPECKQECPIYKKIKYSAEESQSKRNFNTSREVQAELRQMVFEMDNWECQRCGDTKNLHCHHLTGVEINPIESADVDNCITFCKKCHKWIHRQPGCTYEDFKRKKCKN